MDLSIIIIEYFSVEDVKASVSEFCKKCKGEFSFEIIVSSNSCYPPDRQKELQQELPEVRWLFNEKNGGFAYGMNRGLKNAKGNALLISNPDARLKTSLKSALDFLGSHPDCGILGVRIEDSSGVLQDSCREFMWPMEMLYRQLIRFFLSKDVLIDKKMDYTKIQTVDWIIGAFILMRRDVYEKVGGLDEGYFLYVEDMDLNYRVRNEGYQVYYFPEVIVEYKGDRKSTKALFQKKKLISRYAFKHLKSYIRFLRKFYLQHLFHTRCSKKTTSNQFI